jgi:hypothetical protein
MKIHPIFATLIGSCIVADSVVRAQELRGQRRKRREERQQARIEDIEDALAPLLASDFPSMAPSSLPTSKSNAQSPAVIKVCNDTSAEDIRFANEAGNQVFAVCADITENNWQDLACPQTNEHLYANGEMIHQTCGYECDQWTGCGLPMTESPTSSPTALPTPSPTAAPSVATKECEDNSNLRFIVTIPSNATTVRAQCAEITENNWQDELCSLPNERLRDSGVAIYEICGYQCQDLSGCGLPLAG